MTTFFRVGTIFLALVALVSADVSFKKGDQNPDSTSTSTTSAGATPYDDQGLPFDFDPSHYDPTLMTEQQLGLYSELLNFHYSRVDPGDTRKLLNSVGVGVDPSGEEDSLFQEYEHQYLQAAVDANEMHRQLDAYFTREPTAAPAPPTTPPTNLPTPLPTAPPPTNPPTPSPTNPPTPLPTQHPTRYLTGLRPTKAPTVSSPQCGTIQTKDGRNLTLGPYVNRDFTCRGGTGGYGSKSYQTWDSPNYKYTLRVDNKCDYLVRSPETNSEYKVLHDVNSFLDQLVMLKRTEGQKSYKVSSDNFIFSGLVVPLDSDVKDVYGSSSPEECPENYCVKIVGNAVVALNSDNTSTAPAIVYAFSDYSDWNWVRYRIKYSLRSTSYIDNSIYLTNHFKRCDCESYCFDRTNVADAEATCYEETLCGERTFQIAYKDGFPEDQKVSWAKTGTYKIMDWFGACAKAMFGCVQHKDFQEVPSKIFYGTRSWSTLDLTLPKVFSYDSYRGEDNVYGFGGGYDEGFYKYPFDVPRILWTCPSEDRRNDLTTFGESIGSTTLMYNEGKRGLPTVPCPKETFLVPKLSTLPPPVGPKCSDVDHNGYCKQVSGGTCYTRKTNTTCSEMDFVFQDATQTLAYGDADEWFRVCITKGTFCEPTFTDASKLKLTYNGLPNVRAKYSSSHWTLYLSRSKRNGVYTTSGSGYSNYFRCEDFDGAYASLDLVKSMEDKKRLNIKLGVCTSEPTSNPTLSPSMSASPTSLPSMSPTVCSESYLNSGSLNINLAIDLSFSTYSKTFSSTVDIGDVNGDGKGNTILDAQIVAIEELLKSIAGSPTLNNDNCEIHLVSFETDAIDHGTWKPLLNHGSINDKLMTYIKTELRAPTSRDEIRNTNNGYTNFDAALDLSVAYFKDKASKNRNNLLVFLSDGEPNVRGDGDNEMYCADTVNVFFEDGDFECADLGLAPGERHEICRGNDNACVREEKYQDCVRGPNNCMNTAAVTQYDSEISALTALNVERLAIGVGDESNVQEGSALWMIDNNPAKDLGVLPIQALSLEELSSALKNLCILNTEPPTKSPSESPSFAPTKSPAPTNVPTTLPSVSPTELPSTSPSLGTNFILVTPEPTSVPSGAPTIVPSSNPSGPPTETATTLNPTTTPSKYPTRSPSTSPTSIPSAPPTGEPSKPPSESPSGSFFPSLAPTDSPTTSPAPSAGPTGLPSASPTKGPTTSPTAGPTISPTAEPTPSPTANPTAGPTLNPTVTPTVSPTISSHPTFLLPDCYDDEPKLIKKDSSDLHMCFYNPDMIQLKDMRTNNVTVQITNVWTKRAPPARIRAFVHSNGVNSVQNNGDGFQCLEQDGQNLNIETDDNLVTLECFQEEAGAPWLAVMDLVISDENIKANAVAHPCNPEFKPIDHSCSWRVVVPCDTEDLCSAAPSTGPSAGPTGLPTSSPSGSPSTTPSSGPTYSPTGFPTIGPTVKATTEAPTGPPTTRGPTTIDYGATRPPTGTEPPTSATTGLGDARACPSDIIVVSKEGTTPFPTNAIRIVSQDSNTVTVALQQTFTSSTNSTIDSIYYQYLKDQFNQKCYEDTDVSKANSKEITIQCTQRQISLLEIWVADALANNFLSESDKAVVPDCCHPTNPEGTPTISYTVEIRCVSACADQVLED